MRVLVTELKDVDGVVQGAVGILVKEDGSLSTSKIISLGETDAEVGFALKTLLWKTPSA